MDDSAAISQRPRFTIACTYKSVSIHAEACPSRSERTVEWVVGYEWVRAGDDDPRVKATT